MKGDAEKKASEIKTVYAQRATVLEQTAISADKSYLPQSIYTQTGFSIATSKHPTYS